MISLIFKSIYIKIIFFILFFTSTLAANDFHLTQEEKTWIEQNPVVSFTGDPNWLPFEAFDKSGKYIGIVSDHLKTIEQRTGLKFSPAVSESWSNTLDMAKGTKVSIISGDVADAILNVNYKPIEPYLINPIVIVMNHHQHYVDNIQEIKDKKIAVIKGYGYTADLFKHYPNINFVEVENVDIAFENISNGKLDALLVSNSLAQYTISKMNFDDVKIVGKTSVLMELTLFIDKKESILHQIINKTIMSISVNQQQKIIQRWTAHVYNNDRDTVLIIIIISLFLILITFILFYWISFYKTKKHISYMQKLVSAQELGHMGSWEWNIITGELSWSDEVYRIFGEEPQAFPATYEAFKSYIPTEYHQGLESAIDKAMKDKESYEYDHPVIQKDGTLRAVRESGYVRFNEKDEPISMLGTVLDINSIVQAQKTLRENEELTTLLENFDSSIIASTTDLNGVITYASQAFCKVSGYTEEELLGKPQNIIRHPDMPSSFFKHLWKTIQNCETWKGEIKNQKKDGSAYWVESTISPVYNNYQKHIGYIAIRHETTHERQVFELHKKLKIKSYELQELNDSLEKRISEAVESSKQKDHMLAQQSKLASMGEMIGNIAHQWRQPLNALSLLLQKQQVFFERGLLTAEKVEESVAKGTKLIQTMSSTIDDFRDFFKPNKEKVHFNILDAVTNTKEVTMASLYNQNIELSLNIPKDQTLYGYKNEFSQVLLNIINNAKDVLVERNVPHAKITLDSYTQDGYLTILVSDNAGGIPKDIIEHVFEPYFTTKEEGKGTGIGLYMSKMIIEENMDGKLNVHNNEDGATFSITFKQSNHSIADERGSNE